MRSTKEADPANGKFDMLIERLRQATIDATDFNVPWSLFHDELAADDDFMAESTPCENPRLRWVVEQVLQRLDPSCRCGQTWFLTMNGLCHGMAETTLGIVVLYHFAKEDIGLVGMLGGDKRGHLLRFSLAELTTTALPAKVVRGQA